MGQYDISAIALIISVIVNVILSILHGHLHLKLRRVGVKISSAIKLLESVEDMINSGKAKPEDIKQAITAIKNLIKDP